MSNFDLCFILEENQLEQFYERLRDDLQVSRLSHFNYVKQKDLEKIGMSKPAIRRLLDYLKNLKSNDTKLIQSELVLKEKSLRKSCGTFGKYYLKMPKIPVCLNACAVKANQHVFDELAKVKHIRHRNLMKLIGLLVDVDQTITIVTEYTSKGSLCDYLKINREKILIQNLYSFVYQISQALEFLEMQKMIHTKLNLKAIFLCDHDKVKIGNLEFIKQLKFEKDFHTSLQAFGTLALEILTLSEKKDFSDRPDTCSSEIYEIILKCINQTSISFKYVKARIKELFPIEMKAKSIFNQKTKLSIEKGDKITLIDGFSNQYWYKGQNNRTFQIGYFPRTVLNPRRKLNGSDISLPLMHSFFHTGHVSADTTKFWGFPDGIDETLVDHHLIEKSDESSFDSEYEHIESLSGYFQNMSVIDDDELYAKPRKKSSNFDFDKILNTTLSEIEKNLSGSYKKASFNGHFKGLNVRDD